MMSRRRWLMATLAAFTAFTTRRECAARAAPAELKLPDGATVETFDFETHGLEGWMTVTGRWDDTGIVHVVSENLVIAGAPGGPVRDPITGRLRARTDAGARERTPTHGSTSAPRLPVHRG